VTSAENERIAWLASLTEPERQAALDLQAAGAAGIAEVTAEPEPEP